MSIQYQKILLSATDETITSYKVKPDTTMIAPSAFINCNNLSNLEIENKLLTNVGEKAWPISCTVNNEHKLIDIHHTLASEFKGTVVIPNNISCLDEGVFMFSNCVGLSSVIIPDSVKQIQDAVFGQCSNLISVDIPDTVLSVGMLLFAKCENLKATNIPKCLDKIPLGYFWDCINLTNLINNNNKISAIDSEAFKNCKSLEHFYISENVTDINYAAFLGCKKIAFDISPNNQTYSVIDNKLLIKNNTELVTAPSIQGVYSIPDGLTKIGQHACDSNTELTEVIFPDSITEIDEAAFLNCHNLSTLTIPNNITRIPASTFQNCISLKTVKIGNANYIGGYAFGGCSSLTSINLPYTLTAINGYTFSDCISLTEVNIPNSVTTISSGAFQNCSSLTEVNIPSSVTTIGNYAFRNCSSLTGISIPSNLTSLNNNNLYAFQNVKPTSLTAVNSFCFSTSILDVTIPDGTTSIKSSAFNKCSKLTSVTIPSSVTSISYNSFPSNNIIANVVINKPRLEVEILIQLNSYTNSILNLPIGATIICSDDIIIIGENINDSCTCCDDYCCSEGGINYYPEYETVAVYSDGSKERFTIVGELNSNNIPGGAYELRVGSGVTTIATHTFANDTSINILRLPGTVYGLHEQAFSYASNLSIIDCTNMDYPPSLDGDKNVFNGTFAKIIIKDGTYDSWINSPIGNWISNSQFIELIEASDFYN